MQAGIAGVIGLSVTALLWIVTAVPIDTTISRYLVENSVPGGHGRNVVNVILVDFRAFDTLGEILVVAVAAVAAASLLRYLRKEA